MKPSHAIMWLVVASCLVAAIPATAQIEMYAATHPFALPTATTTRLFGMGGFASCVPDVGFANPAFAGALTRDSVVARKSVTSFQSDLSLNSQQVSFAMPLQDNRQGMQISGFRLRSNDATYPGPMPALFSVSEDDLSIHYGRRLSSHWLAGIAISPILQTESDVTASPSPIALLHLESEAKWGFRIGSVYELGDRGWIGAVYDRYDEDVDASGALVPGGAMSETFESHEIVAGVGYRLTDRFLAAVEWQQLGHEGAGIDNKEAGIRYGFEGLLDDGMAVRMGSNQGALSWGFGWGNDDWSVNYAYMRDWNKPVLAALAGGNQTHSFEVTYSW